MIKKSFDAFEGQSLRAPSRKAVNLFGVCDRHEKLSSGGKVVSLVSGPMEFVRVLLGGVCKCLEVYQGGLSIRPDNKACFFNPEKLGLLIG